MMLVNALEMLVAREQTLRLTLSRETSDIAGSAWEEISEGGTPCPEDGRLQLMAQPSMPLPLECRDLSWLNAADREEESKAILRHERLAPFATDGSVDGLFRTLLIRYSALHHVLVFTVHPVIANPADVHAMVTRLGRLYDSLGLHGSLPEVPSLDDLSPDGLSPLVSTPDILFTDRSPARAGGPWQKSSAPAAGSSPFAAKSDLPSNELAEMPPVAALLPADFPRGATRSHALATHSILLPGEQLARMRSACSTSECAFPALRSFAGRAGLPLDFAAFAAFVLWLQSMVGRQPSVKNPKPEPDRSQTGEPRQPGELPEPGDVPRLGEVILGVHSLDAADATEMLPVRCLALPEDNVSTFMTRLRRSMEDACHRTAANDHDTEHHDKDAAQRSAPLPSSALRPILPTKVPANRFEEWVRHQFHFDSLDSFVPPAPDSAEKQPLRFPGLETELVWNACYHVPADIAYCLRLAGGDTYLDCHYNAALFKRETVSRWSAELARLLYTMLEQPEQPLSEVLWLSSPEHHRLLIDLNRTASAYARDSSIQDIFERQVLRTPDAAALINEEGSLTYAELNEKANQLARFLRRYGIARGERIALVAERSLGSVVGALATLKAGCAYIPIDVEELPSHILEVLEHARPAAVLTQARFAAMFEKMDAPVVLMDADWPAVATEPMENIALPIAAEAPACVLYRRDPGSPLRGILLPHRAFVRLVQGSNVIRFGCGEVFLQLARLSEDAWALEVWGPLLNGGQLALLPPGWQAPVQIGSAIEHYGATALWLNPADLHSMVAGPIEAMAGLRQIVTGTGTISPVLLSRLLEHYPRLTVTRGFGPAENGTFTCLDNIPLHSLEAARAAVGRTVGQPAANTRVYILGRRGELVRHGEPGEMHIAGDGLATGYLHDPELTDEKFFMHAFSPLVRERLFRTGILACYREGGRIEVLGTIEAESGLDKLESKNKIDKNFEAPGGAGATPLKADFLEPELEGVEAIESFARD